LPQPLHPLSSHLFSFLLLATPPRSTLFPYTTLFRSELRMKIARESLLAAISTATALPAPNTWMVVPSTVTGRLLVGDGLGLPKRSEEHTSELQSLTNLVCRLLLEKKKVMRHTTHYSC